MENILTTIQKTFVQAPLFFIVILSFVFIFAIIQGLLKLLPFANQNILQKFKVEEDFVKKLARKNLTLEKKILLQKYLTIAGSTQTPEDFEEKRLRNAVQLTVFIFTALVILQLLSMVFGIKADILNVKTVIGLLGFGWLAWFHPYNTIEENYKNFQQLVYNQIPLFVRMTTMFLYSGLNVTDSLERTIELLPEKGLKETLERAKGVITPDLRGFFRYVKEEIDLPEAMQFFDLLLSLYQTGESSEDKKHVLNLLERSLDNYEHSKEMKALEIVDSSATVFSMIITVFFLGALILSLAGPAFYLLMKMLGS